MDLGFIWVLMILFRCPHIGRMGKQCTVITTAWSWSHTHTNMCVIGVQPKMCVGGFSKTKRDYLPQNTLEYHRMIKVSLVILSINNFP